MKKLITILGFAGSLRRNSYNKSLLRAAKELVPEDAGIDIFDLEGIPPFNQDLETKMPEKVKEFKARIKAVEGADIIIEDEGETFTIPFSLVDKARLVPEFDH